MSLDDTALASRAARARRAVFGVLYTLAKERKPTTLRFTLFQLTIDFLQLSTFSITLPGQLAIVNGLGLRDLFDGNGFSLYSTFFWLFVVLIAVSIAICVFVGRCFLENHFPVVWPVRFLRSVLSVFFSLLYVSSVNFLVIVLDCRDRDGVTTLREFPAHECWQGTLLIMQLVAILLLAVFVALGLLLELAKTDPEPITLDRLSIADSTPLMRIFTMKTVMSLGAIFLVGSETLLTVILTLASADVVYQMVIAQPLATSWVNHAKAGLSSVLLVGCACQLCGVLFFDHRYASETAWACIAASPLALLIGYYASDFRVRHLDGKIQLRSVDVQQELQPDEHEHADSWVVDGSFGSPVEVELRARFVFRILSDESEEEAERATALLQADAIYQAGLSQFGQSSRVRTAYSTFLFSAVKDADQGQAQVEEVRLCRPSSQHSFVLFIRDVERAKHQQAMALGHGAVDLVSYVEFQSNLRRAAKAQKEAFRGMKAFWRLLLNSSNPSVDELGKLLQSIDKDARISEVTYQGLLDKNPKSVRLLRFYALFLHEIANDEHQGKRLLARAHKREEETEARVTITAKGIITHVTRPLCRMFGYAKEELLHKNVNILMGPPYHQQHDGYLKRYQRTRRARVLGTTRVVEARHKGGHSLRILLSISKASAQGVGTAAAFTAVITGLEDDDLVAAVTCSFDGTILRFNKRFSDMFEYDQTELEGQNIRMIMPPDVAVHHDSYLRRFREGGGGQTVGISGRRLNGRKRSGFIFPLSLHVDVSGEGDDKVLNAQIEDLSDQIGVVTINSEGIIQAVNRPVFLMFGYTGEADLVGNNVSKLMPEPYRTFHDGFIASYLSTGVGVIIGKDQRVVHAQHADGSLFPMVLAISEVGGPAGQRWFAAKCTVAEEDPDQARTGSFVMTAAGLIQQISSQLLQLAQYREEEQQRLVGHPVQVLLHPPDAVKLMQALHGGDEGGGDDAAPSVGGVVARLRLKGGKLLPISLSGNTILTGEGAFIHITLRPMHLVEAIVSTDEKGIVEEVSSDISYLLGYDPSELMGENVSMITPPEVAQHHDQYLARCREREGGDEESRVIGVARRMKAQHRDGSQVDVVLEATRTTLKDGRDGFTARLSHANCRSGHDLKAAEEAVLRNRHLDGARSEGSIGSGTLGTRLSKLETDSHCSDDSRGNQSQRSLLARSTSQLSMNSDDELGSVKSGGTSRSALSRLVRRMTNTAAVRQEFRWIKRISLGFSWIAIAIAVTDAVVLAVLADDVKGEIDRVGGSGHAGHSLSEVTASVLAYELRQRWQVISASVSGADLSMAGLQRVFRSWMSSLFLSASIPSKVQDQYLAETVGVGLYFDTRPAARSHVTRSLWWLVNALGRACGAIADQESRTNPSGGVVDEVVREIRMVVDNQDAAMDGMERALASELSEALGGLDSLLVVQIGITFAQAAVLLLLPVLLSKGLRRAYQHHYALISIFVGLPRRALLQLAVRKSEVTSDGEDETSDGSDSDSTIGDELLREEVEQIDAKGPKRGTRSRHRRPEQLALTSALTSGAAGVEGGSVDELTRNSSWDSGASLSPPAQSLPGQHGASHAVLDSDVDVAGEVGGRIAGDDAGGKAMPPSASKAVPPPLQSPPARRSRRLEERHHQSQPRTVSFSALQKTDRGSPGPTAGRLGSDDGAREEGGEAPRAGEVEGATASVGRSEGSATDIPAAPPTPRSRKGCTLAGVQRCWRSLRSGWVQRMKGCKRGDLSVARVHPSGVPAPAKRSTRTNVVLFGLMSLVSVLLGASEVTRHFAAESAREPIRHVHAAAGCLFLSARLRNVAQRVVAANYSDVEAQTLFDAPSPFSAFGRQATQRELELQARRLQALHQGVLYGSESLGLESALDRSKGQETLWFGEGCLRTSNTSSCLTADHPLFRTVSSGLDYLLESYMEAAFLLANDTADSLTPLNERFQLIWELGPADVKDGLASSLELFLDEAATALDELLLFVVFMTAGYFLVLLAAYYFFFVPFLTRVQSESTRAAIMLSFLPHKLYLSRLKQIAKSSAGGLAKA